jgi:hypothetical protein
MSGRRARSNGAFTERICPSAGRWKRFPWSRQPGVNRKQMRTFAELDFVAKHENLVLVGPDRRGQNGTRLRSSAEGFAERTPLSVRSRAGSVRRDVCSLADRSTRQLLNRLARLDVLLIDEFGYLNLKPEQSNTFFKLMEERYHRHSTIITTNLGYDEWQNFLGNKSMVEALLSRVRHYCHTVTINGPSLRDPQG